jgi:AcrR family transcriptional regulator
MSAATAIDRRIVRTKSAIRAALIGLIEEKGFEALSVQDITVRAEINRGTFYLHYKDKYDLLEQAETEIIDDFEGILRQANPASFKNINRVDKPLPVVVALFEYMQANAALLRAIVGLKGSIEFQNRIRQVIERNLKAGLLTGGRPVKFLVPKEYLLAYTLSAHLGVIQLWLQNGCAESPRDMALTLSKLSIQGPFHAVALSSDV